MYYELLQLFCISVKFRTVLLCYFTIEGLFFYTISLTPVEIDFSMPDVTVALSASSPSANASFTIRDNRLTEGDRMFTVEANEAPSEGGLPQFVEYPETGAAVTIEDDDS